MEQETILRESQAKSGDFVLVFHHLSRKINVIIKGNLMAKEKIIAHVYLCSCVRFLCVIYGKQCGKPRCDHIRSENRK